MKIELKQVLYPQPKSKIKASDGKSEGKYKFFTSSPMQTRFIDEANYDKPSLIFGTGGNASVHFCDEPFSTSTDCLVMYGRNKIELESIYNYLKGNISLLEHGFKGAGLKHISKDYILAIEIELPSEAMQNEFLQKNRIVDEIIEAKRTQLLLSEDLVKSRFIEMFGTLSSNEQNFEVLTIESLCSLIKDGTHQTPTYTEDTIDGFKFLSSKDVMSTKIDWSDIKYIPLDLHEKLYAVVKPIKNDILMSKNGVNYGVAAVNDTDEVFDIYVSLALLRPKTDIINPVYFRSAINSPDTKRQFDSSIKGIGVPNLHLGEIKKTKILVPPVDKQNEYVSFVEQVDKSKFYIVQMQILLRLLIRAIQQKTTEVLL